MSGLGALDGGWVYIVLVVFIGLQVAFITGQTAWLVLRTSYEQYWERRYQQSQMLLYTGFIDALRCAEERQRWLSLAETLPAAHVRRFLLMYLQRTESSFREEVAGLYRARGLLEEDCRTLRSGDWLKRMRTLRMMLYVARTEELELLKSLPLQRHPERLAVCFVFARLGEIDPLLEQLRSLQLQQRHASQPISAMLWSMSPSNIHALMQRWGEIPDPFLRRALLITAATAAPASGLEMLPKAAADSTLEIRIGACLAACQMSAPRVRGLLLTLLEDETWEVRGQAAKALGVLRDRHAMDALCAAMGDRSFWVRQNSAVAIGRMGDEGLARLAQIVRDGADRYAVDAARQVLSSAQPVADQRVAS